MEFKPIEQYPHRICLDIADHLAPYIQDKIICDLGCGAGDLLEYIRINKLCREVKGVERDSARIDHKKEYVIVGDFFKMPLPVADVYIIWVTSEFPFEELFSSLTQSKTIIYLDSAIKNQDKFSQIPGINRRELVNFPNDESKFGTHISKQLLKINHNWTLQGKRLFGVYDFTPSKKT